MNITKADCPCRACGSALPTDRHSLMLYCDACRGQSRKLARGYYRARTVLREPYTVACASCGVAVVGSKRGRRTTHCKTCRDTATKTAHRKRHPLRDKARSSVQGRIKRGTLTRRPCEVCGEQKTEAHHEDYAKPLEIRWLCRKHHLAVHKALREAGSLISGGGC